MTPEGLDRLTDPYRGTSWSSTYPRIWTARIWVGYFRDYALAFGLCKREEDCAWLDRPEWNRAARYADQCCAEDLEMGRVEP